MTILKSVLAWCFLGLLFFGGALWAQAPEEKKIPLETPCKGNEGEKMVCILYTGKLFGYFRNPNWQAANETGTDCKGITGKTAAAVHFDTLLAEQRKAGGLRGAILLGAGDNFTPELGARDFCAPPSPNSGATAWPSHLGKELYVWDESTKEWIPNEDLDKPQYQYLAERIRRGEGSIPTDNVARFFIDEGYAALVPGKHDFHFGPERLREIARYLSSTEIDSSKAENQGTIHGDHVQMLGVNLVIETNWRSDHTPLSDKKSPPSFIPRFPTGTDLTGQTDVQVKLVGLSDRASVYPFFQGPIIRLQGSKERIAALDSQLHDPNQFQFYLCRAKEIGDPNSLVYPTQQDSGCKRIEFGTGEDKDRLVFPWNKEKEFETLTPGANYGLCVLSPNLPGVHGAERLRFCMRFSVYQPFFDGNQPPYVLLEAAKNTQLAKDVAIFGVVDPGLGERVGLANFAWVNGSKRYKTQVSVKDPAEALKQLLDAFNRKYAEPPDSVSGNQSVATAKTFNGIKVLLAQMTPQQADVLAMRLPDAQGGFQVVVSAADEEMAALNDALTSDWHADVANKVPENVPTAGGRQAASLSAQKLRRSARFLAVPEPYYHAGTHSGIVDIGTLTIRLPARSPEQWTLSSYHMKLDSSLEVIPQPAFWTKVNDHLRHDCLPKYLNPDLPSDIENPIRIQLFTLCAMQKTTEADVVLLQQRDFFSEFPTHTIDEKMPSLQDLLDRIIWKGDFLTVLYVPGSALKKAMEQSKLFDADDKSNLSLSAERQRGLVSLGITLDSERGEYVINGLPLDPNKLYSVATSDFVEAGDTGYPDLAAAQEDPPVTPRDFDKKLRTISSVVCEELARGDKEANCLRPLDRDKYFDFFDAQVVDPCGTLDRQLATPSNTKNTNTAFKQLETWSIFSHRRRIPGRPVLPSLQDQADRQVEQRALWDLSVTKWSLGITALGHNGSDFDVQNNFGGITTSGVNAFRSSNITSDFQAQWTRSWRRDQIFLSPSYTYNVQNKGQPDNFRQVNQVADLGTVEQGYVHAWTDRGPEHVDNLLTIHFETPLTKPFQAFTLASSHAGPNGESIKDQIRFDLDRSYTLLLRPGIRWKKRVSSVEIGPEWGHEFQALSEVDFSTNGHTVPCAAKENVSIAQCVSNALKVNPAAVTPTSDVETKRLGQDHAGIYWKMNLTIPFHPRVSYVMTDAGDSFFVHYGTDNSTGTLLRDYSQHQLKFTIFPSFSIGPELDLLLYQNKSVGNKAVGMLKGHFLMQDILVMKAQFNFDVFNQRKLTDQMEYAPPSSGPTK